MDDSPVGEYRNKMLDWGLPLSQYSQQCQACFAPQSGSGLDIVENTEQGRQANQYRYPRPERRYSVFRNQGTVAPEYSAAEEWLRFPSVHCSDHNPKAGDFPVEFYVIQQGIFFTFSFQHNTPSLLHKLFIQSTH